MTLIVSKLTFLAKVIERMHGESSTDGLPGILQAPSQNPVRVPLLSFNRMQQVNIFGMKSVQCRHERRSWPHPWWRTFLLVCRNREMDGIEPAEAEPHQNPVHLDGTWYMAAACQGGFQFSCSWFIHTGVPINRHWPWSHHRQSADIEGPRSSRLHCLLLPASSAPYRASITLIRCMCITCTCIHSKQVGLLQQFACRHLRHPHSASTVSVACRCEALKYDPISEIICDQLHWLSVRHRIDFKLGVLICMCLLIAQWGFLPISDIIWWRWCYTRVTHSRAADASFIRSRKFFCVDGQIVFGWVLETSRVLGPYSGTFFQLTWKVQIKLSTYWKNCLKHIWSEKLTALLLYIDY